MKNILYKLLFVLCLFAGVSCGQNNQEEMEDTDASVSPETTGTEDTTATADEVPASLQQH